MKQSTLAILIIIICIACLILGIFNSNQPKTYTIESGAKKKVSSLFMSSANKVALINIDGVIDSSNKVNAFTNEFTAQNALKALKEAGKDAEIKGIIVKMNTPGGTVAMSQNIYHEIMRIRNIKPVVVVMEDVAASGGYYIASAADRIYALEGTLTGSIGVIFSTMNIHQLLSEKLLISPNVIKSGKYKDLGSAYRAMTQDERNLLQGIVTDSYSQFIAAINDGRIKRNDTYSSPKTDLAYDNLITYADGRIFTGSQAKKLGFIDEVGDLTDAQSAIKTMVNEKYSSKGEVILVPYTKTNTLSDFLFGASEALFNQKTNIDSFLPVSIKYSRQPLYLWE